jgi:hypothetical protein
LSAAQEATQLSAPALLPPPQAAGSFRSFTPPSRTALLPSLWYRHTQAGRPAYDAAAYTCISREHRRTPATLSPNWQRGQARRRMGGWWQRRHTWRQAVEHGEGRKASTKHVSDCEQSHSQRGMVRTLGLIPTLDGSADDQSLGRRLCHLAVVGVGTASARAHHCLGGSATCAFTGRPVVDGYQPS